MKQLNFFLTTMSIIMLTAACGNSKKATAKEKDLPQQFVTNIKIDGDQSDWGTVPLLYNKEAQSFYALANNGQAIFLLLKITDQAQQLKIIRSGVNIWFDLKGKKEKLIGVKYPLPSGVEMNSGRNNNSAVEKSDMKEKLRGLLLTKMEMELEGYKAGLNGRQPLQSSASGVRLATGITNEGILIYELMVPFSAFPTAIKFDKLISAGIVMNAIERPNSGGSPKGGGQGRGGRGGGGQRGGMAGGRRPATNETQNLMKETEFWYNFSLVSK